MVYIACIVSAIVLDQLTKAWVIGYLRLYESVEIIPGFFNLVYVTNTGAAFSMLANFDSPWRHYFFLGIGLIALIGLTVAYWKLRKVSRYYSLALALIAGGAAGNLIDRVRFGAVIDFLDFYVGRYHWPAFNVADSAICVGAGLFLVVNFFEVRNQEVRKS
ncbi:MAG: signal peptidase II [Desulforhopalus sp.]|nr:signal peptidase II [Desulforhopalus sp.]